MEKLGKRGRYPFSLYQEGKAGGKKKDLLSTWDYGTQEDPISQEELGILEDEWLMWQRKQREHIDRMKTDYRTGERISHEQLPQWIKDEYGKGHLYKGGPLEIRRMEDRLMDDFIEADNKYKMGE